MTTRSLFAALSCLLQASLLAVSAACHAPAGSGDAGPPVDAAMTDAGRGDAAPTDAAGTDAAASTDAAGADAGTDTFPCAGSRCLVNTEYCYQVFSGVRSPHPEQRSPVERDADGGATVGCNSLPAACIGMPTCACLLPDIKGCPSLLCQEKDGGFYLTCALP